MKSIVWVENQSRGSWVPAYFTEKGYNVHKVTRLSDAAPALQGAPHVVIRESQITSGAGMDFLKELTSKGFNIPVVIVANQDDDVRESAGIRMNLTTREVTYLGEKIEMRKMEFDLLKLFLDNPTRAFSREEILNQVWGYERYPTTRTIDTHMLSLRQKFQSHLFETVRGIGYRFAPDVATTAIAA